MTGKNTFAQRLTEKYFTLCGAGGRGELSRVSLISSTLRTPSLNEENVTGTTRTNEISPTRTNEIFPTRPNEINTT
jgi:hypothetical protein